MSQTPAAKKKIKTTEDGHVMVAGQPNVVKSPSSLINNIEKLNIHASNMPLTWKNFATNLKIYMRANNFEQELESRKVAILLACIGSEALEIFYSFNVDIDVITFDELLKKFEEFFLPKLNITMERHKLFNRKQGQDEDIASYATDIKNISLQCGFDELRDNILKDVFSWNLNSNNNYIREKLLINNPKTFQESLDLAKRLETSRQQAKFLQGEQSTSQSFVGKVFSSQSQKQSTNKRLYNFRSSRSISPGRSQSRSNLGQSSVVSQSPVRKKEASPCHRCGQIHRVRCPAIGVICNICRKPNHFSKVCHTIKKVNAVVSQSDSDEEVFISQILVCDSTKNSVFQIELLINNIVINFILDTGAETNILSLNEFRKLNLSTNILQKSNHKLSTFSGEVIQTVGMCSLPVICNDQSYDIIFHVVDLPCKNIIGQESCQKLKLIKRIHNVKFQSNVVQTDILSKYTDLFEGIGCLKDYQAHLVLKPDAVPSIDSCRKVPFRLADKLKRELESLERKNIIKKVEEPTEWVNSLVLTSKKNGKLRLCIDPKKLNNALMRPHFPLPTIDEIRSTLNGARYFSTLDCNKGFWMILLDEVSSKLCTFNTPQGRYRFLRLPFGINAASEIFHSEMVKRFSDLEGVKIMIDDILIYAPDKETHDKRLENVLKRAREINIKFNKEKSVICKEEVRYLGHVFSQKGVKVDESKVKAICDMPTPSNVNELQRFLGMVNYLGPFIDNLSQKTSCLRSLLSKNTKWSWSHEHETEYNSLKEIITKTPVLTYYNPNKDITLSVDSSKDAMGAVICHNSQPIAYASASLTPCQQSYSQIEKELLAILFGCTKFHQYIYGRQTLVETDHKPIVSLMKKPLYDIPPRLQRIMIRLQPYDLKVLYKPGKYLYIADTLSRAALSEQTLKEVDQELDLHINMLISTLSVSQEKLKEIKEKSVKDEVLSQIITYCQNGWPEHKRCVSPSVKPYFDLKHQIYVIDNIVFKDTSIVIPFSMRNYLLNLIHEGHQGINSCIRLAKGTIYWHNINKDIEKFVSQCHICLTFRSSNSKEPLISHDYKLLAWNKVGMDLFEINNKKYLIVVDYFSKYPEIVLLNSSNSSSVITHLKSIFARHGIPNIVISDNGPPFNSKELSDFMREWYIQHITSSPYHSRSNGLVERSIRTIKDILKKCYSDKKDPYLAILQYRNTPKSCGYSPAQMCMSRRLRTRIPAADSNLKPKCIDYKRMKQHIDTYKQKTSLYYNQHTKSLPSLKQGEKVYFKKQPNNNYNAWIPGIISKVGPEPRSYIISSPEGEFRRNREQIHSPKYSQTIQVPSKPSANSHHSPSSSNPSSTSRTSPIKYSKFGRQIRKPDRFY